MPIFFIHTINSTFGARDGGADYGSANDALDVGIRGAVMIAADEIAQAKPRSSVEVRVEREDGAAVLRSVVSISVSPLLPDWSGHAREGEDDRPD